MAGLRGRTASADRPHAGPSILIAGCGTGEHPFDIAQKSPEASVLAIDLSRVSLAYARRKTREEGLRNIEYAQADILNLSTLDRTFDRIETAGVLHHLLLADDCLPQGPNAFDSRLVTALGHNDARFDDLMAGIVSLCSMTLKNMSRQPLVL
jgi:SAM-dependent methyltransferase